MSCGKRDSYPAFSFKSSITVSGGNVPTFMDVNILNIKMFLKTSSFFFDPNDAHSVLLRKYWAPAQGTFK